MTKAIAQVKQVLSSEYFAQSVKDAVPTTMARFLTPARLTKLAMTSIKQSPRLAQCRPETIASSLIDAAQLGLDPSGGVLGQAYLVPYKDTCQLIVGYRGLIALARRSGTIKSIQANLVREGDVFDMEYGTDQRLRHKPSGDTSKPVLGAYAIALLQDGSNAFEYMSLAEIEAIRARSKSGGNGPWRTDWGEMARKTVVRRLCKYLPMTVEVAEVLSDALSREDAVEYSGMVIDVDGDPAPPTKVASLREKIVAKKGEYEPDTTPAGAVVTRESKDGDDDGLGWFSDDEMAERPKHPALAGEEV